MNKKDIQRAAMDIADSYSHSHEGLLAMGAAREIAEKAATDMAEYIMRRVSVLTVQHQVSKNTFNFAIPYVQENFEKWVDSELVHELCRKIVADRLVDIETEDSTAGLPRFSK